MRKGYVKKHSDVCFLSTMPQESHVFYRILFKMQQYPTVSFLSPHNPYSDPEIRKHRMTLEWSCRPQADFYSTCTNYIIALYRNPLLLDVQNNVTHPNFKCISNSKHTAERCLLRSNKCFR